MDAETVPGDCGQSGGVGASPVDCSDANGTAVALSPTADWPTSGGRGLVVLELDSCPDSGESGVPGTEGVPLSSLNTTPFQFRYDNYTIPVAPVRTPAQVVI